ncbi:MAG: DUF4349 domain-containing protein [Verrucomicrobiae bacterium]|nr:DUF4349 domain-containing protein [Verrucomicrobiae bacterium]
MRHSTKIYAPACRITLLVALLLLLSCHQNQSGNVADATMEEETMLVERRSYDESPPPIDAIAKQEVIKKKIIKDGRLSLRVSDLENSKVRVDTIVQHHGGYYANEKLINTDWETSYHLNIRIPSENFARFISDIETGDGEILIKEINARDVTDKFIDLETRLENKRNYLKRYNDLLLKANSIKEILEIEEKIRALEEEIESATGQLKYLSDQVDYSTLDLTISTQKNFKYSPENRDKFTERLKQSLSKGWFGLVDFFLFLIHIWPIWIIGALVFYLWRKYKMRSRRK